MEKGPLERAAAAIDEVLDLRIAHMTGREMLDDGTITPVLARLVLQAIREPSEGMIDAGCDTLTDLGCNPVTGDERTVWQAMIDAALSE